MISFSNNVNKLFREINKKKCFRPLAKENCINFSENSTILIFIVVISEMRKVLHYCILKTLCVQDKSDCIHLVFQNKSIMFPFYFCYIFISIYLLLFSRLRYKLSAFSPFLGSSKQSKHIYFSFLHVYITNYITAHMTVCKGQYKVFYGMENTKCINDFTKKIKRNMYVE